jgi:hypothetical protein
MAVFRPRRGVELGAELEPYRPPDRLTPPAVFSDRAFIGAKSLDLRGRHGERVEGLLSAILIAGVTGLMRSDWGCPERVILLGRAFSDPYLRLAV